MNMGLQTLHLRMAQHCKNAQRVAEFLSNEPKVAWVRYCGLKGDKSYDLGQKYLPNGSCGVIAFGLKGTRETAIQWMDSLHRDACGRCPHLCVASRQSHPPSVERRAVA